jgi:hypothetical protein
VKYGNKNGRDFSWSVFFNMHHKRSGFPNMGLRVVVLLCIRSLGRFSLLLFWLLLHVSMEMNGNAIK